MTAVPIGEDELGALLATPARSAFRLETLPAYALGYERADFDRFLDGDPVPPAEADWWRPWLEMVRQLTAAGKTVSRVRVLDEPPTAYQRWMLWAAPWHAEAGERIDCITRSRAIRIGLPLERGDWWLIDDERLVLMRFTADGEIAGKTLITGAGEIAPYLQWRDLAVRNATPAAELAAA